MKLQRMLQNGSWVDETKPERVTMFLDKVIKREPWYAPRMKREPMTTTQEVIDFLSTGRTINYDSDWYAEIRDGEIHERLLAERKAKQKPITETLCACGHYSAHPMNTSSGTSCPDCYDRMSE